LEFFPKEYFFEKTICVANKCGTARQFSNIQSYKDEKNPLTFHFFTSLRRTLPAVEVTVAEISLLLVTAAVAVECLETEGGVLGESEGAGAESDEAMFGCLCEGRRPSSPPRSRRPPL